MSRKRVEPKRKVSQQIKLGIHSPNKQSEARHLWLILILAGTAFFLYLSSLKNGWTNWDDEGYVLNNDLVKSLNLSAIFSSFVMGNYHPVTVLVQAIEYHFFYLHASFYHIVSLVMHIANAVLLFYVTVKLFQNSIAAFLCSLLFAIHPLHVESVSWISAQKDLLYTGFYFASIFFYMIWIEVRRKKASTPENKTSSSKWYIASIAAFIISCLSKAQAVTLPVILLLIDVYLSKSQTLLAYRYPSINVKSLINKIPFFIFSIFFGIIAIIAQKQSSSIQEIQDHSILVQWLFASFAFVEYIIKTFMPLNLSAFYPYAERVSGFYPIYVYTAPVIILILLFLIIWFRKSILRALGFLNVSLKNNDTEVSRSFIAVIIFGLLFFTVNIFLVLQLLPVGGAVMADRYTYLSSAGIFFPLSFFLSTVWIRTDTIFKGQRSLIFTVAVVWIAFLLYTTSTRTGVWYSSESLWTDVISKYPRAPIAQNNLGSYYQKHDQPDLAKKHFDEALNLQPDFTNALINRCDYYRTKNQIDSALIDGNHAVHLSPDNPDAYQNRGIAYSIAGKLDSAFSDFKFVIAHEPGNAQILNNLGNLYSIKAQYDSAVIYYNAALRADPGFLDVLNNRGKCYVFLKRYQDAVIDLSKAIEMNPQNGADYYFRMQAYDKLGLKDEARADAQMATHLGIDVTSELGLK